MSNTSKFIDRNPDLISAGVTAKPSDGSIFLPPPRVVTPSHVARARAYQSGAVGTRRLNPSDIGVDNVVHGVETDKTQSVADVLAPPPKTFMQTVMESRKDALYASAAKPLGATATLKGIVIPDPSASFGVRTAYDGTAAECLQSPADSLLPSRAPGTQTRRYGDALNHSQQFGKPSPHDDAGGNMRRTLRWVTETEDEQALRVRSKIDEDFHERTDAPLGRSRSAGWPMPEPRPAVPSESAKNVIYMLSAPVEELDADARRNRQHGIVSAARHKLKKAGFEKFGELEAAFRAHDVTQQGSIDPRRIPTVCRLFVLPLDENMLEEVAKICVVDGNVSYVDFVALLDYNRFAHTASQAPFALQPTRAGGVPTIRADKAPPRIRRVCDFTNYGDEGDAASLVNPSTMAQQGVHARDLLCPRSQAEIRVLFSNLGVPLDDEHFAALWDRAARMAPSGEVSVESFRVALSEIAQ
eukprot:m.36016 g.36016  ORF g.36016 m.36016 type:complete len:470 (-) comp9632_c2_seq1:266-1675(-)